MKQLMYIPLLLLAIACGGSKETVSNTPPPETKPTWAQSRPIRSLDYIGIGIASKARPDFIEVAKKNALNDLASEIKVNISGNSFLHTMEREYKFEEEFMSSISATTDQDLEGYKLQGTYDGANEYWVYYRLSKAEHAHIQKEKRDKAKRISLDLYGKANEALAANDLQSAMNLQLKALLALKEYWGEENKVEWEGEEVFLENEIFSALQRTTGGLKLSCNPSTITLNHGNEYRVEAQIRTQYTDASSFMIAQVPLNISYQGIHKKVKDKRRTGDDGSLNYVVNDVEFANNSNDLLMIVDLESMINEDVDKDLAKAMLKSLPRNELRVPIRLALPKLYLSSSETNLDKALINGELASTLKGELTKGGFEFTNYPSSADIQIDLSATTRQGGESNGFFISYLDLTLTVKDRRSGLVIYQDGEQGLKGVQLNYEKAGLDAYKKAGEDIKKKKAKELTSAIL